MPSIFAGEVGEWKPTPDGPTFQFKSLDYWAIQPALSTDDPIAKIRCVLTAGLIAVDGDEAAAKSFIERPAAGLVNPLFEAIWKASLGNWTGAASL